MLQAIPVPRPAVASADDVLAFLALAPAWESIDDALVRRATAPTFAAGIRWVTQVAEVADRMDHHPDIDIRWRTVTFALATHSEGGITDKDVELAREIDRLLSSTG